MKFITSFIVLAVTLSFQPLPDEMKLAKDVSEKSDKPLPVVDWGKIQDDEKKREMQTFERMNSESYQCYWIEFDKLQKEINDNTKI